ncbi:MAG: glycosyltransferase family 39 protein [Terriglobia bacterium]
MTSSSAQPHSFLPSSRSWLLLLVVAAGLFFIGLGRLPLLEPDEGRNAEVAREMLKTHDWITPHYDGLPYLDKPAFFFWMVAGSFRCFGLSEWAARLPSALLALGTALLAGLMGKKMFGARAGIRAGIILAASPLVFAFARLVIFDMPLTFLVSLALFFFWLGSRQSERGLGIDVAAFASMGIATLIKGPVGFLLPLITLAVYHALSRQFRKLRRVHWAAGWGVFLVITLPWFIEVCLHNPGFARYALWRESLLRFATGGHLHRTQGPFYYIPIYFGGFFPWSFFLLCIAWGRLKQWRALGEGAHRSELFLLSWAGVVFVFFTISHSKLPGYFLPAMVPLSLLVAAAWKDADAHRGAGAPDWLTAGCAIMILIGILMAGAAHFLHFHGIEHQLARKLPLSVSGLIKPTLLLGGIIIAALGFLGRNLAVRSRRPALRSLVFVVIALTIPLLALRGRGVFRSYFSAFSSRQLAQTLLASPQRDFPVYGFYYFRTGLPFYLRRPVGLVTADGDELTSNYIVDNFKRLREAGPRLASPARPGNIAEASRPLLVSGKELRQMARNSSFLLMVQNHEVYLALRMAGSMRPLWESWKYSVWEKKTQ